MNFTDKKFLFKPLYDGNERPMGSNAYKEPIEGKWCMFCGKWFKPKEKNINQDFCIDCLKIGREKI